MRSPMSRRLAAVGGSISPGIARRSSSAWAVGSTQLAVPGVQFQPRSEVSCRASLVGNNALRIRHQSVPSAGHAFNTQSKPRSTAFCAPPCRCSASEATEVTQQPCGCPGKAGHEPSANCAFSSQSRANVHAFGGDAGPGAGSAASAQAVASTALGAAG